MAENKKEKLLEGVLNFQIPREYFSELSDNEVEDFNQKMFANLISRIIHKLADDLGNEHLEAVTKMLKKGNNPAEIIKFSIENSKENALEKIGQEVMDFTEEVYNAVNQ